MKHKHIITSGSNIFSLHPWSSIPNDGFQATQPRVIKRSTPFVLGDGHISHKHTHTKHTGRGPTHMTYTSIYTHTYHAKKLSITSRGKYNSSLDMNIVAQNKTLTLGTLTNGQKQYIIIRQDHQWHKTKHTHTRHMGRRHKHIQAWRIHGIQECKNGVNTIKKGTIYLSGATQTTLGLDARDLVRECHCGAQGIAIMWNWVPSHMDKGCSIVQVPCS